MIGVGRIWSRFWAVIVWLKRTNKNGIYLISTACWKWHMGFFWSLRKKPMIYNEWWWRRWKLDMVLFLFLIENSSNFTPKIYINIYIYIYKRRKKRKTIKHFVIGWVTSWSHMTYLCVKLVVDGQIISMSNVILTKITRQNRRVDKRSIS